MLALATSELQQQQQVIKSQPENHYFNNEIDDTLVDFCHSHGVVLLSADAP